MTFHHRGQAAPRDTLDTHKCLKLSSKAYFQRVSPCLVSVHIPYLECIGLLMKKTITLTVCASVNAHRHKYLTASYYGLASQGMLVQKPQSEPIFLQICKFSSSVLSLLCRGSAGLHQILNEKGHIEKIPVYF